MKRRMYLAIAMAVACFACNKEKKANDATCENIQNITLYSNSPVAVGKPIEFGTQEVGGYRVYSWTGPNNFMSQDATNSISEAQLQNEGWYFLNLTHTGSDGDCQKIDSVYIDISLPQGSAPCSIGSNTTQYNNLSDDAYSSVIKAIDPTYSLKTLSANGGVYSNLTIYFHPYWRTAEPEDGIYITTNIPLFDQADNNYNKLFITTTKNSSYWASAEGQSVYVSHVNGKLQVRFCSLSLGDGTYQTMASGNVIEQ